MLTTAARDIGCFDLLYTRYTLECPAHNERTGTAVDGGGPFHNKIVEQVNLNRTRFHDLRYDNTRNMTPPLRSIVFVRIVRRLRDLYYSQAARRKALSGGAWVACYPALCPTSTAQEYTALATSLGTRIRHTKGCWDARFDVEEFHIYLVPSIYVVLFPCFGNTQQYQPLYLYASEETTPYNLAKYQAWRTGCGVSIIFCLFCMICCIQPHPMPDE